MKKVVVYNALQNGYTYTLSEPEGKNFAKEFKPELTPQEMLELGVFGGAYFAEEPKGIPKELPKSRFTHAKVSLDLKQHKELNFFGVLASQSREEWQKKGWIHTDDPRGWFEWYCRYYVGRRHADDARQIKRWNAMRRHVGQIVNSCRKGDFSCHTRQRQAVLHWAYDARRL